MIQFVCGQRELHIQRDIQDSSHDGIAVFEGPVPETGEECFVGCCETSGIPVCVCPAREEVCMLIVVVGHRTIARSLLYKRSVPAWLLNQVRSIIARENANANDISQNTPSSHLPAPRVQFPHWNMPNSGPRTRFHESHCGMEATRGSSSSTRISAAFSLMTACRSSVPVLGSLR